MGAGSTIVLSNNTEAGLRNAPPVPARRLCNRSFHSKDFTMNKQIDRTLNLIAGTRSEGIGLHGTRIAIAIIFLWIGGLKFVPYEADSITPFVANNPVMSLFYEHPAQYAQHLTREGDLKPADRAWQTANNTYGFSAGLGMVEVSIGLLTLLGVVSRRWGFPGAILAFLTPFVTLSFLVTTPEAWVPALGDAQHGFPYLSGGGRLVIKDVVLMAGAWLVMVDSARAILGRRLDAQRINGQPSDLSTSPARS
jgi:reactive chlorine resistance protein C